MSSEPAPAVDVVSELVGELGRLAGVEPGTLYTWASEGRGPKRVKLAHDGREDPADGRGGLVRYRVVDLLEYQLQHLVQPVVLARRFADLSDLFDKHSRPVPARRISGRRRPESEPDAALCTTTLAAARGRR